MTSSKEGICLSIYALVGVLKGWIVTALRTTTRIGKVQHVYAFEAWWNMDTVLDMWYTSLVCTLWLMMCCNSTIYILSMYKSSSSQNIGNYSASLINGSAILVLELSSIPECYVVNTAKVPSTRIIRAFSISHKVHEIVTR